MLRTASNSFRLAVTLFACNKLTVGVARRSDVDHKPDLNRFPSYLHHDHAAEAAKDQTKMVSITILTTNVKSTTVLSTSVAHSVDSFLDFAVPLVSLTLNSLALCTIFNLKQHID